MKLSEEQQETLIILRRRFNNLYPELSFGKRIWDVRLTGRWILESLKFDNWDDLLAYARTRGCDV